GTRQRKYTTMTCESWGYKDTQEEMPADYEVNKYNQERLEMKAWEPLTFLVKPLTPGPVAVQSRGKEIILAAGFHAVRIHLGLEACISIVSLEDYRALVGNCAPGPNRNKSKANRLRSFILPSQFVVPGCQSSLTGGDRLVNVFGALVCQDRAIIVTDFSRLVRFHVFSRPVLWSPADVLPKSEYWGALWDKGHGPDWIYETEEALYMLDAWRTQVLEGDIGPQNDVPIIASLYSVQTVFNGLGKHTANDLLHLISMWPGTPTTVVCKDNEMFGRLRSGLPAYMAIWASDRFLKLVATPANHTNPFAFNHRSHRYYMSEYVHVYRKSFCMVSLELFNDLTSHGMLDEKHILGEWHLDNALCGADMHTYKVLPVYDYQLGSVKFYSTILARRPTEWKYALNGPRVSDS
ncbi:hypothetical protein C8Q74DRAFT_1212224, partial [Fomes fomentarius]